METVSGRTDSHSGSADVRSGRADTCGSADVRSGRADPHSGSADPRDAIFSRYLYNYAYKKFAWVSGARFRPVFPWNVFAVLGATL